MSTLIEFKGEKPGPCESAVVPMAGPSVPVTTLASDDISQLHRFVHSKEDDELAGLAPHLRDLPSQGDRVADRR